MGKLGNTLAMLKILESGRKYTVNELAEQIEVTPRMIKEYKSELEKAGIYIDSICGIYGGYVYKRKDNYDVTFNIKDINVLEKLLSQVEERDVVKLEQVIEKIRTIVIYSSNEFSEYQDDELSKKNYNIISKALKSGTELTFLYRGKNKKLIPHNLSFYKDNIYVTGYSAIDDDLRTYNILEINFK